MEAVSSASLDLLVRIREGIAAGAHAIASGPRALIAWVRREPARALAYVWLGGMVVFAWQTYRRAYRKHQAEVAAAPPTAPPKPKRPPEVVRLMDVDELDQIRADRLHELGLAAPGEERAPDAKTIEAARVARSKGVSQEGERVAGDGDVVIVTKGGIQGWIERNKNKKPDPETLKWLRGEEKKDGIKAYAEWADDGAGNSIAGWIERGKRKAAAARGEPMPVGVGSASVDAGAVLAAIPDDAGAGSAGSGSGSAVAPAPTSAPRPPVAAVAVEQAPVSAMPEARSFDAIAIGASAILALDPVARFHRGEPSEADVLALADRIAEARGATVAIRSRRLIITIPGAALFAPGDDELGLTADGRARAQVIARALDAEELKTFDVLVMAPDPDRAMAVVAALAVAGVATTRVALGTPSPAASAGAIELALIAPPSSGPARKPKTDAPGGAP